VPSKSAGLGCSPDRRNLAAKLIRDDFLRGTRFSLKVGAVVMISGATAACVSIQLGGIHIYVARGANVTATTGNVRRGMGGGFSAAA
jgi:hypothetical protein